MALPSGYTQLDYVISGYETFLRLGTTFGKGGVVDVYIDCITTTSSAFWGGSDTSYCSQGYYAGAKTSGTSILWYSDDDGGTIGSCWSNNVRHTYKWQVSVATWGTYIDGSLVKSSDDKGDYGDLYVLYGKFPTGSTKTYFYGNVYEMQIGGYTFTPALRDSDNVAGFYCSNGTFYSSGGDVAFTAGPVTVTSTIYKGEKLIPTIYLGTTPIKAVYYREHQLLG